MRSSEREFAIHLPELHPRQGAFVNSDAKRIIVRAGRRGGKTFGVSDRAVERFLDGKRVLYAAPTQEQVDRFWTLVCRFLREPIDGGMLYKNETRHIIEVQGTERRIRAKTAWSSDTLRGDYADELILDEFQLMDEDAWGLVGAPMLADNDGNATFIYTPPSLHSRSASKAQDPQHAAKLFKRASLDESGRWATFHFTSRENPHISQDAINELANDMTSLAYRMEILAEDINEAPGALWTRSNIDSGRVMKAADMEYVVVGVDPSATATGDEAGIVTVGRIGDQLYTLADDSIQASPHAWATAVVTAFHRSKANLVVAEANNGGEMVSQVIKQVDTTVPVELVHASRGKATRAEPIAAIYEQGRAHHVGAYPALEDEMCLAAGTMITTRRGNVPIENVTTDDYVLTRNKYCRVIWSGKTGDAKQLIAIKTYNDRHLLATVHHPVYTKECGFIKAANLKNGYMLETDAWHTNRLNIINTESLSSGTKSDGLSTIAATTWIDKALCCIGRCGNYITEKYQTSISFITKMAINLISPLKTLKFQPSSIMPQSCTRATDGQRKNGSIYQMFSRAVGMNRNRIVSPALDAGRNLKAQECVQSSVMGNADKDTIASIDILDIDPIPVYNLNVENMHEYYANGILVHNCLWQPGDASPNRMDALVWAATKIIGMRPKRAVRSFQG